jgi:hypothetical protein
MANILHMAQNMEEELPGTDMPARANTAPPLFAFVAPSRGSHDGRDHPDCGGRNGRSSLDRDTASNSVLSRENTAIQWYCRDDNK